MSLELKLQQASAEFQQLQADLSTVVEARQRLDAQLSENELVKKVCRVWLVWLPFSFHLIAVTLVQEFAQLTSGNTVYKLIGPVLVKQDQAEAKSNVNTRLDFIRSEMSGFSPNSTNSELTNKPCSQRVEGQIKDIEQKQEKKKTEVSFHSSIVLSLSLILPFPQLVQIQTALRQTSTPPASISTPSAPVI